MDFNEYQKLAIRTAPTKDKLSLEMHSLHGMSSEVGEIHGIYQKAYQGHAHDKHHVMSEISDLLWFIAEWCTANDYKLEDVAQYNIDKLKKRYPDGFSSERSLHRKNDDIQTYSSTVIIGSSNFITTYNFNFGDFKC